MSTSSLDHVTLSERQRDAHNLASLAGTLAHSMTHDRSVHPDDAGKPDLCAVAYLLAEQLERLVTALDDMVSHDDVLRARMKQHLAADAH